MRQLSGVFLLALAGLLVTAGPAAAQKGALDLIPENAAFGLVIRSLADFQEKGDRFIERHHIDMPADSRPSTLFRRLFEEYLKIKKGLDPKGGVALLFPDLGKMGVTQLDLNALFYLMVAIPYNDLDAMGSNFGYKPGELKAGKALSVPTPPSLGPLPLWRLRERGKHIYLSARREGLDWLGTSRPLTAALTPLQRRTLAGADIALQLSPKGGDFLWKMLLDGFEDRIRRAGKTDSAVLTGVLGAMKELRFIVGGLQIGEGGSINVIASFPPADQGGKASAKFLETLRAGPGYSDLNALPAREPIFAYAARGNGVSNVAMARTLVNLLLGNVAGLERVLPGEDRARLMKAFETFYQNLRGSRLAVYQLAGPGQPAPKGELAAVAILDIAEANRDALTGDWAHLLEVANRTSARAAQGTDMKPPRFAYKAKAEMIEGTRIDHLIMEVPGLSDDARASARRLLGPDWDRLRIAVLDRSVVVLFGSEPGLIGETLKNLARGEKGLAASPAVTATLARLSPERKLEFHMSLRKALPYLGERKTFPAAEGLKDDGLSSIALIVEPERLQLQVAAPGSDITPMAWALGFRIKDR